MRIPSHESRWPGVAVVILATMIAIGSARPYAGAWYDGSRLATVESLVDRHTLAIDDSIFVVVPPEGQPSPYPDEPTFRNGTGDKLLIAGHYYSDKSPAPALLMAGVYQCWQWCTGITAREEPHAFCYGMTLVSSGLPYVIAVWCIYSMAGVVGLSMRWRLLFTASFALATIAPVYAQHVNNHILLLGVTAGLFLCVVKLTVTQAPVGLLILFGLLTGLGYSIDLGVGPPLFVCALVWTVYRFRSFRPVATFVAACLPFMVLHHAVNYAVGGTFKPANAVPEYFLWPGCSFNPKNMTGSFNHTPDGLIVYAAALLFGKRGFVGHDLPLFLAVAAIVPLLKRRPRELPEILLACCWSGAAWLAYAVTSNNSSGVCCSIRWFVPLLAPAFLVLAIGLRELPAWRPDFLALTGWGMLLSAIMCWYGPWIKHMVPLFWPIQVLALTSWGACRHWRRDPATTAEMTAPQARAA